MKYSAENAVSSFFYYMWNAWSKEECKVVFGGMYKHFWEKWNSQAGKSIYGAAERFYAELSECNRTLLVERAVSLYDGKAKREKPQDENIYVCNVCGSVLFEIIRWVNMDTGESICEYNNDNVNSEEWCTECDEVFSSCTMKGFKEKMQSRWNSCDFKVMEQITGLKETGYPSDNGSQAFIDAADQWWNSQNYERQRKIYNEYNYDNE